MNYRGYVIERSGRDARVQVTHPEYGPEVSALEDGRIAVMMWRCIGAAMAAIDRTFDVPHPPPHEAGGMTPESATCRRRGEPASGAAPATPPPPGANHLGGLR